MILNYLLIILTSIISALISGIGFIFTALPEQMTNSITYILSFIHYAKQIFPWYDTTISIISYLLILAGITFGIRQFEKILSFIPGMNKPKILNDSVYQAMDLHAKFEKVKKGRGINVNTK